MNPRIYRDGIKMFWAILFFWLYIPHILMVLTSSHIKKTLIFSDLEQLTKWIYISPWKWLALIYFLHNDRYYRTLFYCRIGAIRSLLISWYRPKDPYFSISYTARIDEGFHYFHPFSTIINAESIGKNFSCLGCTTIGAKEEIYRPVIGDNVALGTNVTIIGAVKIGNNVTIGAGSVVVKDVPDNVVVAGNPARIIRQLDI